MTEHPGDDSRRLLTSLCCGLLLLAPLSWTLGRTSYVGVALGLLGSTLTAVAFGLLLRRTLPDSLVTALLTAACLLPLTLVALLVAGPRSDGVTTTLALGLPAAAVSAALTMRFTTGLQLRSDRKEDLRPGAVIAGISLALCLATLAPNAHSRIAEARAEAHLVAALQGSGVLPLRPEVDGFSLTEIPLVQLGSDSYPIELVADGEDVDDAASIRIEAGPLLTEEQRQVERTECEVDGRTCSPIGEDVLVMDGPDDDLRVIATVGGTRLEAFLYEGAGTLPEPTEVGKALNDAELVSWDDVLQVVPEDY